MIQCASAVLMIRPSCFGFNEETAESNAFQQKTDGNIQQKAIIEFDAAVELLRSNGLNVIVAEDSDNPLPDSVFPNNWFSTHHDGTIIIYPMQSEIRRKEKRMDLFHTILPESGYQVNAIYDLSYFERENKFLEGTGSMVMDHERKIIYACRSSRTHEEVLAKVAGLIGYQYKIFNAFLNGKAVYHTNVLMAIGKELAVICTEVTDPANHFDLLTELLEYRETLVITSFQLRQMAGNMLMLTNKNNEQLCVLSDTAFHSLFPNQIKQIESLAKPVVCSIPTIEKTGGGSIRCMMAEIFLPEKPIHFKNGK